MFNARLEHFRKELEVLELDAFITTNLPDVRWLCAFSGVFDESPDHLALVTRERFLLHTDGRYSNAFEGAARAINSSCEIDSRKMLHVSYVIEHLDAGGAIAPSTQGQIALGFDAGTMSVATYHALAQAINDAQLQAKVKLVPTTGVIKRLRAIKDAYEIDALRRAQAITDAGFKHLCEFMQPGMREVEVALELEHFMRKNGSDGISFDTIAATGANSANPHAVPGNTVIKQGDFLVLDFGAKWDGYHADMTRTVCFGAPSALQQEIYEVTKHAHEAAAALIAPGKTETEIYQAAFDVIDGAGYGDKFTHGLGHGVGLEIHEYPNLKATCQDALQAGELVTVEPGIYLNGIAGCRLEDFGLIHKVDENNQGFEPFTQATHELICL